MGNAGFGLALLLGIWLPLGGVYAAKGAVVLIPGLLIPGRGGAMRAMKVEED